MSFRVSPFPSCCGAKIVHGFPSYIRVEALEGETRALYTKRNQQYADHLEKDLRGLFLEGYTMEIEGEKYHYRTAEGGSLGKNAFVIAITNDEQDPLVRPVLEKFGFKKIEEKVNPNSGHMVFFYILYPDWQNGVLVDNNFLAKIPRG